MTNNIAYYTIIGKKSQQGIIDGDNVVFLGGYTDYYIAYNSYQHLCKTCDDSEGWFLYSSLYIIKVKDEELIYPTKTNILCKHIFKEKNRETNINIDKETNKETTKETNKEKTDRIVIEKTDNKSEEKEVYIVHDIEKGYFVIKDLEKANSKIDSMDEGTLWCYKLNQELSESGLIDEKAVIRDKSVELISSDDEN